MPTLRLIHTADWHLGHTLAGHHRGHEHAVFLAALLEVLERERPDALLIAGDVYDQGHPPPQAQHQLYDFLATCRRRFPDVDVVVIGGNHDTAARLDAPSPVLRGIGVTMIGGLPRDGQTLQLDRAVVPIHRGHEVVGVVAAVPFLRPPDLSAALHSRPTDQRLRTSVIDATRVVVDDVAAAARTRFPGVPVIAMAHCEMQGARLSLTSERSLGGAAALPPELFAQAGIDYTALGHLHLAQALGVDGRVRYSGSPLPLSMAERHYEHQVLCIDVDGAGGALAVRGIAMPRPVDFLRLPDDGSDELPRLLDRLAVLDLPERSLEERPFLEVRVRLDAPVPDLRARIEAVLADKPVRLVRIERETTGDQRSLPDVVSGAGEDGVGHTPGLSELSPTSVFRALYGRHFEDQPSRDLVDAFEMLVREDREQHRDDVVGLPVPLALSGDARSDPEVV